MFIFNRERPGLGAGCDFSRQLEDHEVFWRRAAGRNFYSARDLLWRLPWSLSGCLGGSWVILTCQLSAAFCLLYACALNCSFWGYISRFAYFCLLTGSFYMFSSVRFLFSSVGCSGPA